MQSLEISTNSGTANTALTYDVKEAAAILGVSLGTAYEAVKRNQIPSIRLGRKIVVPRAALHHLLDVTNQGAA